MLAVTQMVEFLVFIDIKCSLSHSQILSLGLKSNQVKIHLNTISTAMICL